MHRRSAYGASVQDGCFITLTYNDAHLPPDNSLDVSHFQNFMKKLRRHFGAGIRFLHCGEYGPNGGRPHYHACLFGVDFHSDRKVWKKDENSTVWLSDTLDSLWSDTYGENRGFTTLGPLNFATASYTAGYVMKKLKTSEHIQEHAVYGSTATPIQLIKPEYVTMSRRPGLGTSWFEKYWSDVYPADQVRINGKAYRPPAFYDRLLLERDPDLHFRVMEKRREFLDDLGPTDDLTLRARGEIFSARASQKPERKNL